MDGTINDVLRGILDDVGTLEHHGIRGMKWGVRRSVDPSTGRVSGPSEDAAKAAESKAIAKKHGVSALSNDQLKELNKRLELESKFNQLNPHQKSMMDKGKAFVLSEIKSEAKLAIGASKKGSQLRVIADALKPAVTTSTKSNGQNAAYKIMQNPNFHKPPGGPVPNPPKVYKIHTIK